MGVGRAVAAALFVAHAVACSDCASPEGTWTITSAEAVRVTQGTAAPTPDGCVLVCNELLYELDASAVDAGRSVAADAATAVDETRVQCTLSSSGDRLRCIWPVRCAR